jgi:hypothetical protein
LGFSEIIEAHISIEYLMRRAPRLAIIGAGYVEILPINPRIRAPEDDVHLAICAGDIGHLRYNILICGESDDVFPTHAPVKGSDVMGSGKIETDDV